MPSLRDIAVESGVSIGTVDRVLHNRGRVSKKTRSRVEQVIARSGYRPNIYGRNLSLAKVFRFGVLMPKLDQDSGYWRIPTNGINRAHRELGAAKVEVEYFHFDRYVETSFERAFQKAFQSDLDGYLIAPVLAVAARRLVATIPSDTPYVFFDSTIPGLEPLASIAQDPYQSGVLAASLMSRMKCIDGSVAVIKVVPEDFHISERLRGFRFGIRGLESIQIHEYEVDSHGGEAAFQNVASQILAENPNLLGVFVSNAWTHPFARYFKGSRGNGKVCIVGYDLVAKNQKLIEEGMIDFLISQRPGMQGYEGIQALYRHAVLQDRVKKSSFVPLDIITKENVKYYHD